MVKHLRSAVREPCNGSPLPPANLGVGKALWDGVATAKDGRPYENTYSWFLQVQGEKIVSATAFFDTQVFNDFWTRISPDR